MLSCTHLQTHLDPKQTVYLPDRDLNSGPLALEAHVLTPKLRRSPEKVIANKIDVLLIS